MADQLAAYDSDEASMQLGRAWGLAHLCAGEESEAGQRNIRDIRLVVQYIASTILPIEAVASGAPPRVEEAIRQAAGVARVVADELVTEYAGRVGQHWNDEVTSWALSALAESIEAAKDAVDEASSAEAGVAHG